MSELPRGLGLVLLAVSISVGAPHVALAQTQRQVLQQERLVNVLLGQNQARINADENAISRQEVLISELPGRTPRQEAQLLSAINRLTNSLESAVGRLEAGVNRTELALNTLSEESPPNPFVASQLALYLQRTEGLFSAQLQEADFIVNYVASPTSFSSAVNPLNLGHRSANVAASASLTPAQSRLAAAREERATIQEERQEARSAAEAAAAAARAARAANLGRSR